MIMATQTVHRHPFRGAAYGLLLGIGTISTAVPHIVRVEVYRAAGVVDAQTVTLTVRGDVWRVDTSEPVDPEVLVSDE